MTTMGDRVLNRALPKIGEKSLFTKDLEEALKIGDIDLIVHSLKDLPTELPTGMSIGAVLERDDPRDALVLNEKFSGKTLATLPEGSLIGTSSLRRTAQLSRKFPHLKVCDIRGNLNTRLAKLDAPQSKFSGIVLANAGLQRMGWMKRIDEIIEPKDLLYAVGQGALAVECRANDCFVLNLLSEICSFKTQCQILSERSFLKTLGGGCSAPVGTHSQVIISNESDKKTFDLILNGAVWSLNGETEIVEKLSVKFDIDSKVEEEDDEEVTPTKRQKLSQEDSPKKLSPTIIHDNIRLKLTNLLMFMEKCSNRVHFQMQQKKKS
jgi:hydroxymethylbilane synthase